MLLSCVAAAGWAQTGAGGVGAAVERETRGLTSEEFAERQAALKKLEGLIAEQVRQRAAVQEVVDVLRADLAAQNRALGMVADEEAQAQIAGLLETERGLAGWTIQVMSEPTERRKQLMAWGLGKEGAGLAAQAYAKDRRVRIKGIKELAKSTEMAAGWTLGRLINDPDAAIRASAMAAAWEMGEKSTGDMVTALWHRAIAGPALLAEREEGGGVEMGTLHEAVKVDFPGGDPLEFESPEDQNAFTDALLAADVLVHIKHPQVEARIKELVAEQAKKGKTLALASDPDWTLATHRLVEAYKVTAAIPLLAEEALSRDASGDMNGDVNGRPYVWSVRTMAAGVIAVLAGKEPEEFKLFRVKEHEGLRGWTWGTDQPPPPQANAEGNVDGEVHGDIAVVKNFYGWWKDHYKEYGVKTAPSSAAIPRERVRGARGRPRGPAVSEPAATQPGEEGG